MNYAANRKILKDFYDQLGLATKFEKDNNYLEKAYGDIYRMWLDNFCQIDRVNFLMIAEAPLWGKEKIYIYNPDVNNSQFFYRSDLGDILNKPIADKKAFIKICNEIGLIIVDISPFPLNPRETAINYRDLSIAQYRKLVSLTIPTFFGENIMAISIKKSENIKTFFRYARVKKNFQDLISQVLIDNNIIKTHNDIEDISQNGGGVDKNRLKIIIKAN